MDFSKTFQQYEALVAEADKIFKSMKEAHGDCVHCEVRCSDCCNAVFDITLVEAVYIKDRFDKCFARKDRRLIVKRAEKTDREYYRIKRKLQKMYVDEGKSPEEVLQQLAMERVRCPLLNQEDLCDLYANRPITCRVYGIPTSIGGKSHTCEMSSFKEGTAYPAVNLDKMNDRLFELSKQLLQEAGSKNLKMHISLVPPSVPLMTTYDKEYFGV